MNLDVILQYIFIAILYDAVEQNAVPFFDDIVAQLYNIQKSK